MKIRSLKLQTTNLSSTTDFYSEVLGLLIKERTEKLVTFIAGSTELTFIQISDTNATYHFAFLIPSNKVDEALAYISERVSILPYTKKSVIADFSNWNAHAFYFYDNEQNIVECIAHHDLDNKSDSAFSAISIIGICEIGIVVRDVMEECEKINSEYGVPYYTKGPKLHNFSVMGDEEGLFIVSEINRGWIPTQQPALRYPIMVTFENEGTLYEYTTS
jgi:catechol 2,3-dioxygenase-like lactoylglutathione lyase family enzyme